MIAAPVFFSLLLAGAPREPAFALGPDACRTETGSTPCIVGEFAPGLPVRLVDAPTCSFTTGGRAWWTPPAELEREDTPLQELIGGEHVMAATAIVGDCDVPCHGTGLAVVGVKEAPGRFPWSRWTRLAGRRGSGRPGRCSSS
jgi:hypothetical protein